MLDGMGAARSGLALAPVRVFLMIHLCIGAPLPVLLADPGSLRPIGPADAP
jgi:hypothetical protein